MKEVFVSWSIIDKKLFHVFQIHLLEILSLMAKAEAKEFSKRVFM
jgi:hypothetical protein